MKDQFGREIDYLRISVTDRCSLHCVYCRPGNKETFCLEQDQYLSFDEIELICRQAARLGIRKVRLTGGEPLLRPRLPDLVKRISAIPGIEDIYLTTNGLLLESRLEDLCRAGLSGVNISLDTLDPGRYRQLTGSDLADGPAVVISAMRASLRAGLRVRVNAVAFDGGWTEVLKLAEKLPIDVRVIELMPIGAGMQYFQKPQTVRTAEGESAPEDMQDILLIMKRLYPDMQENRSSYVQKDAQGGGRSAAQLISSQGGTDGPAVCYTVPGYRGRIGVIRAVHGKFCGSCNRIRLTADGRLKGCLCYEPTCGLRDILRREDISKEETASAVNHLLRQVIYEKPAGHCFDTPADITETRFMSSIGG